MVRILDGFMGNIQLGAGIRSTRCGSGDYTVSDIETIQGGSIADNGERIRSIISKRRGLVVYVTESGKPGFECSHELVNRKQRVIRCHDALYANINLSLRGKQRDIALTHLAYALNNSLISAEDDPSVHLEAVEELVRTQASEQARSGYTVGSTLSAVSVLGLTALSAVAVSNNWLSPDIKPLLAGVAAGCAGAWASVIQRSDRLLIETFATPFQHGLAGAVRVLLGCIFGAALVMLSKGNIIAGFASGNMYMLAVFALISGLNERFIPETLTRVQARVTSTGGSISAPTDVEHPGGNTQPLPVIREGIDGHQQARN